MVEDETQPVTYKVDTWTSFHHDKERIINALISDEEIYTGSIEYDNGATYETPIGHFIAGAKWYREQLKQK